MSRLEITRHRGYQDALRKWKVFLDGEEQARIRRAETITLEVQPGEHRLWLTVDDLSSVVITFEVAEGQTAEFSCQVGGISRRKPHIDLHGPWD